MMEDSTSSLESLSTDRSPQIQEPRDFEATAPLSRDKLAQADWLGFDQVPLTPVDTRHYSQVATESIVASIFLFTACSIFIFFVVTPPLSVSLLLISILALVLSTVSYLRFAHAKSIGYGVCDNELLMQKGVIWFKRVSLPYTRLQHISLSQGPVERKFGLHTLKCFSAGSGSAEIELPGLESRIAERLRQHLLAKAGTANQTLNADIQTASSVNRDLSPAPEPESVSGSGYESQQAEIEQSASISSHSVQAESNSTESPSSKPAQQAQAAEGER